MEFWSVYCDYDMFCPSISWIVLPSVQFNLSSSKEISLASRLLPFWYSFSAPQFIKYFINHMAPSSHGTPPDLLMLRNVYHGIIS